MSDYLENKSLDHNLGTASFASPAAVYVGLFTSDPTDANTGTEVTDSGYARQQAAWTPASGGVSENSTTLTFGPAAANWGTITHFAVFDAPTNGNMLYHGQVATSKAVAQGDLGTFLAGDLVVRHQ